MTTLRSEALVNGPPRRDPSRVDATEGSLNGRRAILSNADDARWIIDLRVVGEPYWYDEVTGEQWDTDQAPPYGSDPGRARQFVRVCKERDWYTAAYRGEPPMDVKAYHSYSVWVE